MKRLTEDEFLDSEDVWKDRFSVQYIDTITIDEKISREIWKVTDKVTNRSITCYSMISAFSIATVAQCILNVEYLPTDHVSILKRVEPLLGIPIDRNQYCKKVLVKLDEVRREKNAIRNYRARIKREKSQVAKILRSKYKVYSCTKCSRQFDIEIEENDDSEVLECLICSAPLIAK